MGENRLPVLVSKNEAGWNLNYLHEINSTLYGSQDLRFDDRARKELLLRTEECRSKLWLDAEERKTCASRALTAIKRDGESISGLPIRESLEAFVLQCTPVSNVCHSKHPHDTLKHEQFPWKILPKALSPLGALLVVFQFFWYYSERHPHLGWIQLHVLSSFAHNNFLSCYFSPKCWYK